MEQPSLPFHVEQNELPEHPIVILRFDHEDDRVISTWPELGIYPASFPDWHEAIAAAVHPLNAHACVKVHV